MQMGGLERALSSLANYFVTCGHEVFFLTLFNLEPFFVLDKKVKIVKCPFEFSRKKKYYEYIIFYIKTFSPFGGFLRNKIKNIDPDVIMCFGDVFPQISMVSLYGISIPFYLSNRSAPNIAYSLRFRFFRTIGYLLQKPTGVIAQTSDAAERKRKLLGSKANIQIIPNPARKVKQYNVNKENWVVSVGRLHHEKGFDRLIRSFAMVNAPSWKLIIAGTGKNENEIKELVNRLGLNDRVIFLGKVENIDKLLCKSKIFVLPSYGEGFPNALCEAMASGLACISFDIIAGPRDIINDGINGYLIKDGDIEELSNKIQYLIDNEIERNRIGKNAEIITDKYSIEVIGDEYLKFILESIK